MQRQQTSSTHTRINLRKGIAMGGPKMQEPEKERGCHTGLLLAAVIAAAAMLVAPVQAAITFNFNYTDAPGIGFNAADPLGLARRTALAQTGVLLSNLFPGLTATITIDVNGAETDDSTLAAAGSNFSSAAAQSCTAGYNRGDVGIKALGGADPAPETADGTVTVNFEDTVWDLDDTVDPAQFDFKSTMLHELLHAFGFSHSVTMAGTDGCRSTPPTAGGWVPYDEHLGNTTKTFIDGGFVMDTAAWAAAATGGTGDTGVLWRGTMGMAANRGAPVPLFSPTTFSDGSSIAHLDDDFFNSADLLMEAATVAGPGVRTLSTIEFGMMEDIGYLTSATGNGVNVDVKANGSDSTIAVSNNTPVSITISLNVGNEITAAGDMWVGVYTSLPPPLDWITLGELTGWQLGIVTYKQGTLSALPSTEILNIALPTGSYLFFFVVDDVSNGVPELKWWDTIQVNVQ